MMNTYTETNWNDFYQEGQRYLQIVKGGSAKNKTFTPEILYNLACMGIEKIFMAYFLKVKKMPSNHTLLDLVESMNEIDPVPEELEKELLFMNDFQEICSIEHYERKVPTPEDIQTFIGTMDKTNAYITGLLDTEPALTE